MQVLNCEQAGTFLGFSASETSESEFITGEAEDGETVRLHPAPPKKVKRQRPATSLNLWVIFGHYGQFGGLVGVLK